MTVAPAATLSICDGKGPPRLCRGQPAPIHADSDPDDLNRCADCHGKLRSGWTTR